MAKTEKRLNADRYRASVREMARKMTEEEKRAYLLNVYEHRNIQDSGKNGKHFEPAVSLYLSQNKAIALYVKPQDKPDKVWQVNNVEYIVESKTGAGSGLVKADKVQQLQQQGLTAYDMIDYLYPTADYIVYTPEYNPNEPVEVQGCVFARNEFIEMLKGYEGNGCLVRIHPDKGELAIQTFSNSEKKKAYLWDMCLEQPNLETFREGMLGE